MNVHGLFFYKKWQCTTSLDDGNPDAFSLILSRLDAALGIVGIVAGMDTLEDLRNNLHLSFTLTITVFSNSSDAVFRSIARPNMLFYS